MSHADYWVSEGDAVRCILCRHRCLVKPGQSGLCRVRVNHNGTFESLVYGRLVAEHLDPVEKKPLFHFLPGTRTFSIATVGCNFRCRQCQNHTIAQFDPSLTGTLPGVFETPTGVVEKALACGASSISYTYTEPTVFFEFARDTARLAADAGLANIFVTNGYIEDSPLDEIAPLLDAANIDLKGFDDTFYRKICGASLERVLDGIRSYRKKGIWLEITTLVIPGVHDVPGVLEGIANFIFNELGSDTPWHVSRFFPNYRMQDRPPTSGTLLESALEAGRRAGLRYVYVGNLAGGMEDTVCWQCGNTGVKRNGHSVVFNSLANGKCGSCGAEIAGVWSGG